MKKWFLDFDISDAPICCETYYDKELQKRMVILENGDVIDRPLVDLYDTEIECIEAGFEELKTTKYDPDEWPVGTDFRKVWEMRYSRLKFHMRRIQFNELGL